MAAFDLALQEDQGADLRDDGSAEFAEQAVHNLYVKTEGGLLRWWGLLGSMERTAMS